VKIKIYDERVFLSPVLLIIIPMTLSAFTHLWNPIGFPAVYIDEEGYIGRAMHVLQGLGPTGYPESFVPNLINLGPGWSYDHPYFGALFLAGVFAIIDNTHLLNPSSSSYDNALHSIKMLYMVPRILMGILAVVDTLLIYKIAEFRYNRNVALIASVLFAVMPLSWLVRMIVLDSILIPFVLSSILFALYTNTKKGLSKTDRSKNNKDDKDNKNIVLILLSGIFLGLAIFTKVPAFFMIPLVASLIYHNSNKHKLKTLGLWFIPVILIPMIYPAYAMYIGQLDVWERVVTADAAAAPYRHNPPINPEFLTSLIRDFRMDPVLIILGIAGLAYAAIKRDLFILIFIVPYLVCLATIAFAVVPFHFSPLLPGFCIASSKLIIDLTNRLGKKSGQQTIIQYFGGSDSAQRKISDLIRNPFKQVARLFLHRLPFCVIFVIGIFGLISTTILIGANVNWVYYRGIAFVAQHLPDHVTNQSNDNSKVTVISEAWIWGYPWILKYVFHKDVNFLIICCSDKYQYHERLKTEKVIFIRAIDHSVSRVLQEPPLITKGNVKNFSEELLRIYDNAKVVATFNRNISQYYLSGTYVYGHEGMYVKYPFSGPDLDRFFLTGIAGVEIKSNY